ncbi:DNA-methyltransferase [Bailinhaonella thermotolerans]|uniref:Methyltransferase n=1 Tax=Bailinhaonella thermotolerans TaxID=1070861 RepID=A0A3A4B3C0_9ACTN|nr:site-specific DNA-methyltransferase [Bailinhaonella thermotolerans]RJL31890.1 site-specific DNA-methyltransferase [Bailinhaonella thermotolerans]
MRPPYWSDDHTTLYLGDAREVLTEMPTGSADCIVTSPPYYGLRDYAHPDQYGQEPTPEAYTETLRATFAEARRVLADDGTCWLNLGDCYAANSDGWARGEAYNPRQPRIRPRARLAVPPKNLLGMPWRVAFALQADGWIIRNAIVWHKPNAMPQSVLDRLSTRHELIFLLVKQRRYWFDLDAIRQPYTGDRAPSRRARRPGCGTKHTTIKTGWPPGKYTDAQPACRGKNHGRAMLPTGRRHDAAHQAGANPGDVWSISTRPLRQAHFAAFPIDIPLRAIAAGCRPGGTVLDPFSGAATTALAARRLGRHFSGIEINETFCDLARARILATIEPPETGEAQGD